MQRSYLVPIFVVILLFGLVNSLWSQAGVLSNTSESGDRYSLSQDTTNQYVDSLLIFPEDSAAADTAIGPKLTIRNYDHKQQVIVGGVVMLCIGLVLVANNNYNPRR